MPIAIHPKWVTLHNDKKNIDITFMLGEVQFASVSYRKGILDKWRATGIWTDTKDFHEEQAATDYVERAAMKFLAYLAGNSKAWAENETKRIRDEVHESAAAQQAK